MRHILKKLFQYKLDKLNGKENKINYLRKKLLADS